MRNWRKLTWVILAWNVIMVVWLIAGIVSVAHDHSNCQYLTQQECNNARFAGGTIGVAILVFFWVAGDVILGVIWLITGRRPSHAASSPGATSMSPAGWYPDPNGPGGVSRWWDGQRWTEQTAQSPTP